jgi:hypothetical protein
MAISPGESLKCFACDMWFKDQGMLANHRLRRKHLRRLDDVSVLAYYEQASAFDRGDQVQTISSSDELEPKELEVPVFDSGFIDGGQEPLDSARVSLDRGFNDGGQEPLDSEQGPSVHLSTIAGAPLSWTCVPCSRDHWLLDLSSMQPFSWNCSSRFHGLNPGDIGAFSMASLVEALPCDRLPPGCDKTGDSPCEDIRLYMRLDHAQEENPFSMSHNQGAELQVDSQDLGERMSLVFSQNLLDDALQEDSQDLADSISPLQEDSQDMSPVFSHNFLGDELLDDRNMNRDGGLSVKRLRLSSV